MRLSQRQQKKNSKILEYLMLHYKFGRRIPNISEIVFDKKNKWRTFAVGYIQSFLSLRCFDERVISDRIKATYIGTKRIKTTYIVWSIYSEINSIIRGMLIDCPKYSKRGDINFSTLLFFKMMSNNLLAYFEVEYRE